MKTMFSVVTITYNNVSGLQKTAQSVNSQTLRDFEWVVVDGGSNDGSIDFLKEIECDRLHFKSEPDRGIFDAMNKGLDRCNGNYVIFMNAGDCFANNEVLDRVSSKIGSGCEHIILYGDSLEFNGKQYLIKYARSARHNSYSMFTHHQSQFYRTDDAKHLGYDLSYRLSADWVMTTRLLQRGSAYNLQFPVCNFERGGISQRREQRRILDRELFRIYREEQRHSLFISALLWITKTSSNKFREVSPRLYDLLRFKDNGDAGR